MPPGFDEAEASEKGEESPKVQLHLDLASGARHYYERCAHLGSYPEIIEYRRIAWRRAGAER
jgi:hypothetical protein